jgi:hypothetical protein
VTKERPHQTTEYTEEAKNFQEMKRMAVKEKSISLGTPRTSVLSSVVPGVFWSKRTRTLGDHGGRRQFLL